MSGTISINDREVLEFLYELGRRVGDMTPLMDRIGAAMEVRVSNRFETQTDPAGVPWAPWAPSTKLSYPDDGNNRILDRYGHMLDSLSHEADSTSTQYGFALPYAAYHEFETDQMPRRGMLTLDPDAGTLADGDIATVLDVISDYLEQR